MAITKEFRRERIKNRVRKVVSGDDNSPRLTVFRSNKEIYVQLVDDLKGHTLISASSSESDISSKNGTKIEKALLVGKSIAAKALEKGINQVKFDRNGYLYHGRIKSLAEGAREGGLKF